ncbi:hypothetical protein HDV05_004171 [Chytridiales sp. JEL 0842]|nr:hypothetical protein HDV05_004171 [Chytridiales sp. JEL 0842]
MSSIMLAQQPSHVETPSKTSRKSFFGSKKNTSSKADYSSQTVLEEAAVTDNDQTQPIHVEALSKIPHRSPFSKRTLAFEADDSNDSVFELATVTNNAHEKPHVEKPKARHLATFKDILDALFRKDKATAKEATAALTTSIPSYDNSRNEQDKTNFSLASTPKTAPSIEGPEDLSSQIVSYESKRAPLLRYFFYELHKAKSHLEACVSRTSLDTKPSTTNKQKKSLQHRFAKFCVKLNAAGKKLGKSFVFKVAEKNVEKTFFVKVSRPVSKPNVYPVNCIYVLSSHCVSKSGTKKFITESAMKMLDAKGLSKTYLGGFDSKKIPKKTLPLGELKADTDPDLTPKGLSLISSEPVTQASFEFGPGRMLCGGGVDDDDAPDAAVFGATATQDAGDDAVGRDMKLMTLMTVEDVYANLQQGYSKAVHGSKEEFITKVIPVLYEQLEVALLGVTDDVESITQEERRAAQHPGQVVIAHIAKKLIVHIQTLEDKYRYMFDQISNNLGWWKPDAQFNMDGLNSDMHQQPDSQQSSHQQRQQQQSQSDSQPRFDPSLVDATEWTLLWKWRCSVAERVIADPSSLKNLERGKLMALKKSEAQLLIILILECLRVSKTTQVPLPPLPAYDSSLSPTNDPSAKTKLQSKRKRSSISETDANNGRGKKRKSKSATDATHSELVEDDSNDSSVGGDTPSKREKAFIEAAELVMDRLCIWDSVSIIADNNSSGISKEMVSFLQDIVNVFYREPLPKLVEKLCKKAGWSPNPTVENDSFSPIFKKSAIFSFSSGSNGRTGRGVGRGGQRAPRGSSSKDTIKNPFQDSSSYLDSKDKLKHHQHSSDSKTRPVLQSGVRRGVIPADLKKRSILLGGAASTKTSSSLSSKPDTTSLSLSSSASSSSSLLKSIKNPTDSKFKKAEELMNKRMSSNRVSEALEREKKDVKKAGASKKKPVVQKVETEKDKLLKMLEATKGLRKSLRKSGALRGSSDAEKATGKNLMPPPAPKLAATNSGLTGTPTKLRTPRKSTPHRLDPNKTPVHQQTPKILFPGVLISTPGSIRKSVAMGMSIPPPSASKVAASFRDVNWDDIGRRASLTMASPARLSGDGFGVSGGGGIFGGEPPMAFDSPIKDSQDSDVGVKMKIRSARKKTAVMNSVFDFAIF